MEAETRNEENNTQVRKDRKGIEKRLRNKLFQFKEEKESVREEVKEIKREKTRKNLMTTGLKCHMRKDWE